MRYERFMAIIVIVLLFAAMAMLAFVVRNDYGYIR